MSIIYFIFAVLFYTVSQLQQHGKIRFKGQFWDSDSHLLKWKRPLEKPPNNFYYRWFKLEFKEKFPLSGTLFVFQSDGYHLSQMLFKVSIIMAIVSYKSIFGVLDIALFYGLFWLVFNLIYKYASK